MLLALTPVCRRWVGSHRYWLSIEPARWLHGERIKNRAVIEALHFDHFVARATAPNDRYRGPRNSKVLRNQPPDRFVGASLDCRRCHADDEHPILQAD